MKLPKQLAAEQIEEKVRQALAREHIALCTGSTTSIPVLKLTPELHKQIFYAKAIGELTIGFDSIEAWLLNEQRGLQKVAQQSPRISRMLLVTNDGSPRFYRELEYLDRKHGDRLMICRLDTSAATLANVLGLESQQVKAIMINRKKSVVNVLKSLL